MMKDKIIIYGLGACFERFEKLLKARYEIVLCIDNGRKDGAIAGSEFEYAPYKGVSVFIMTDKYYSDIRSELIKKGVTEACILNGVEECRRIRRAETLSADPVASAIYDMENKPLSNKFGLDRGTAIDRVFIEHFLKENKQLVRGDCLEIAENTYSLKYGEDRIKKSYIMHYEGGDGAIKGDLVTGNGIPEEIFDCAIITQTMMFLKDPEKAAENIYRMLKDGGAALLTVSGISPVSMYDHDRWGHFYSFYDDGIASVFEPVFGKANVEITPFGNVKLALGFVYGMCAEDFSEDDFKDVNPEYPIIYGIVLHRRGC